MHQNMLMETQQEMKLESQISHIFGENYQSAKNTILESHLIQQLSRMNICQELMTQHSSTAEQSISSPLWMLLSLAQLQSLL